MRKYNNQLVAITIGDGFVTKNGVIGFKHSIKQKEWLLYKVSLLISMGFTVRIREFECESYGKMRKFIEAHTNVTKIGKELRAILYPNEEKIIPIEIVKDLGFEDWATIYQDDGRENKISHYNTTVKGKRTRVETEPFVNRYDFSTQGFNLESNKNLQKSLSNLGIDSSLQKVKGGYGQKLVIGRAKSKGDFYENIKPHLVNCMEYKMSAIPYLSYS